MGGLEPKPRPPDCTWATCVTREKGFIVDSCRVLSLCQARPRVFRTHLLVYSVLPSAVGVVQIISILQVSKLRPRKDCHFNNK